MSPWLTNHCNPIRVLNRARYYWIVTYVVRVGDEDRLIWSAIDWAEPRPVLRPFDTPEEVDEANCMVSLV